MPPCGCKRFGASNCELWRIGTTYLRYLHVLSQPVGMIVSWKVFAWISKQDVSSDPLCFWLFQCPPAMQESSLVATTQCIKAFSQYTVQYIHEMILYEAYELRLCCASCGKQFTGAEMSTPLFPNLGVATSCDAPHRQRFCIERTLSSVPLESPNTPLGSTFGTVIANERPRSM